MAVEVILLNGTNDDHDSGELNIEFIARVEESLLPCVK